MSSAIGFNTGNVREKKKKSEKMPSMGIFNLKSENFRLWAHSFVGI